MKNYAHQYLEAVIALLRRIDEEESEAIRSGAVLLADAIEGDARIFGFGCTHSSLSIQNLVYRAGGLMLINPILAPGISSLDVRPATMTSAIERLEGYAEILLDNQPIQSGDVLILVSMSGRNAVPVEMAMLAKERGIRVIGVTAMEYTRKVPSRHPSGKRMYEYADVVIDVKVPPGDAILEAAGVPAPFSPASGVASSATLQALVAATVEELLARGITPPVFVSGNVPGGEEHNRELIARYGDRVFYL